MSNYNERLDEILDKFFEVPYPDYNMGILPDEDGYDAFQERRNYEESYARDEAKATFTSLIKELVAEARIDELEKFVNTTNRSLSVKKLRDRLSALKSQQEEV